MSETGTLPLEGRTPLRRRYLLVTTAVLAVVAASLSVSFAADSGTSTSNVTTSSSAVLVYSVGAAGTVEDGADITLPRGSIADGTGTNWDTVKVPSWGISGGSSGTVPASGAGDLTYLDATGTTSTTVLVSVFVTNMGDMASNYSSWAFNIGLHSRANAPTASNVGLAGWTLEETQVVTSDSGTVRFVVDLNEVAGDYLAISLDEGGSFYTVQTTNSAGYGPEFFIRVTQL